MARLDFDVAKSIAASLITIGHPFAGSAIEATAWDLVEWCGGCPQKGRQPQWSPEQQAAWLVKEARTTWPNGWPERGGTMALLALFRGKFESLEPPPPLGVDEACRRGLINRPCEICEDRLYLGTVPNMLYCLACPEGRRNARWSGEQALHKLNTTPPPVKRKRAVIDLDDVLRRGQAIYEDEQQRKREQIKKTLREDLNAQF